MDIESEFDKIMKGIQLEEARAKAEKAKEEARHERSKREKTECETENTKHSKWHDGIKTFATLAAVLISGATLAHKMKDKK